MDAIHRIKRLVPEQHPARLVWHKSKTLAAAVRYGFPARKLTIIGITGTDGKTTTVGMTAHILQRNNIRVGALSTAFFQIDDQITWNATQKTSPSPFVIQKFLRDLLNEGCTHAVLEVSSHGLVQGRTNYTWPAVAAITNLAEEHLDYHLTMAAYADAKAILFRMLQGKGTKVLNMQDQTYNRYSPIPSEHTITYGVDTASATISASNIQCHASYTQATISLQSTDQSINLQLPIPGAFNVNNALCAISCGMAIGLEADTCIAALRDFRGIPGRMEQIHAGQPFTVYVDFTVTPQSYEQTLSTLRRSLPTDKRLLVLTGSCGDRMKEKRPLVGNIVSKYADMMVVANEDPYTEDPEKIIDEVWAGIDQTKTEAHRIFDRKQAIAFLLEQAKEGDTVIFCGKGSDTTMWLKDGQIPWNEREIIQEILTQ